MKVDKTIWSIHDLHILIQQWHNVLSSGFLMLIWNKHYQPNVTVKKKKKKNKKRSFW